MTDLEWIICNDCPTTPARVIGEAYDADPVSRHCGNCDSKGGWFACSWCGKPECECLTDRIADDLRFTIEQQRDAA